MREFEASTQGMVQTCFGLFHTRHCITLTRILNNFAPSVGTWPVVDLLAGSAAGGTAVLCTYPLDLVRTKLAYQVSNVGQSGNALGNSGQQQTYNGIKDVFKTVYKEGGARSLGAKKATLLIETLLFCRSEISSSRRSQEICYTEALLWSFSWSIWANPHLSDGCCPEANAGSKQAASKFK